MPELINHNRSWLWHAMARQGPLWRAIGRPWPVMVGHGPLWPAMGRRGPPWLNNKQPKQQITAAWPAMVGQPVGPLGLLNQNRWPAMGRRAAMVTDAPPFAAMGRRGPAWPAMARPRVSEQLSRGGGHLKTTKKDSTTYCSRRIRPHFASPDHVYIRISN